MSFGIEVGLRWLLSFFGVTCKLMIHGMDARNTCFTTTVLFLYTYVRRSWQATPFIDGLRDLARASVERVAVDRCDSRFSAIETSLTAHSCQCTSLRYCT